MNFLEPISLTAIAQLVWPLCRIGAFFGSMFAISSRSIPMLTKALTAMAITLCMLPNIPDLAPNTEPFSVYGILVTMKTLISRSPM